MTLDVPLENIALFLEITDAMGILKKDTIISEETPDWHKNILKDRMIKYQGGKTSTTSWEDFERE